jgi:hypothetical protein
MITREELARELRAAWNNSAVASSYELWLRVADRALELLKGEKP